MTPQQLREVADRLFGKKQSLNSLHQEIAENFYPERADFTVTRSMGDDFAARLMTSYPVVCRRELGNNFSTMLRPTARPWFHPQRKHESKSSADVQAYLEYFEKVQRRAMYDRNSMFNRATKEGDHDFAAIGQCAISVTLNRDRNGLLYRSWHIRDMAWEENESGQIGFKVRKWKPTAYNLVKTFPKGNIHQNVKDALLKDPFTEVNVYHIVCDAEMYDEKITGGQPRWSLYYDTDHETLIEAVPLWGQYYVIPRWQTVSGSQYSYSPATVCALPDARLIQAMTFTLLEAGEKAASPPMLAAKDVIRGDMALYAGGVTFVDQDYDERTGEALRPLTQNLEGFKYGLELNESTRQMIHKAFYLDAMTMPERAPEMTAFEVGQRVQEWIRQALPIFEPMESEYNGALCDETFDLLWRNGAFGNPASWPRDLRNGGEIDFTFESPLHDVIDQQKGQKFQEAQQLIASAIALDPSAGFVPNATAALRDALHGIGAPATWINSQAFVDDAKKEQAAQAQAQQRLSAMEQASNVAKNVGASGMVAPQNGGGMP